MHFTSTVIRPPYEARSTYLQVTSGCSHNKCKYCSYYKNVSFNISSNKEIQEDIIELKNRGYSFKRIWLQGANPFVLSTQKLEQIAKLIHRYLPFVESIGGYSRVDDMENKTITDLKKLRQMKYNSIVLGIESGDDKLLKYMNKGYKSDEIIKQVSKLEQAGIKYTLIFLSGLGGHKYGYNHAKKTAQVFNQLKPERIMINQLEIKENTTLYDEVQDGIFTPSKPEENNKEIITFLETLTINTFIDATNNTNNIQFFGKIQENKENIIRHLKEKTG